MLALARKKGESIIIGDNIEITLLDIKNDQVKIGINAPKDISIHRKEVYVQIQEVNKEAAKVSNTVKKDIKNLMKKIKR